MTASSPSAPTLHHYKLYALLRSLENTADLPNVQELIQQLACFQELNNDLNNWWEAVPLRISTSLNLYQAIADSSDRVNLHAVSPTDSKAQVPIRHPISGEPQAINPLNSASLELPDSIKNNQNAEQVFWWFWRFYPGLLEQRSPDALLFPAHRILPDCPLHSYQATVSALVGAMLPAELPVATTAEPTHPYLLLFTFSPVQEFIKASRKFVDFWAGSYLLHYLSAKLCWHIARKYGPDAVIVPSLWGQEIFDALLLQHYQKSESTEDSEFTQALVDRFKSIGDHKLPVERFSDRTSTSLSTAGFPNMITALVPGKEAAQKLGEELAKELKEEWQRIGKIIRDQIRETVSKEVADTLNNETKWQALWQEIKGQSTTISPEPYLDDLRRWQPQLDQAQQKYPGWEWRQLWEHQLGHTWEPYWASVPLGVPGKTLTISRKQQDEFDQAWRSAQQILAQAWVDLPDLEPQPLPLQADQQSLAQARIELPDLERKTLPLQAETKAFTTLNVGTWWGSLQQRLRLCVQAVKNTRVWEIPVAPGERSTISGQFSAVHPSFNYRVVSRGGVDRDLREGGGLPEGSMRLFWLLMSKAYPGLFNGSERLNALELTKRMAWIYGGLANTLGIETRLEDEVIAQEVAADLEIEAGIQSAPTSSNQLRPIDYERLIRFPNLSSIASARFVYNAIAQEKSSSPRNSKPRRYWNQLARAIKAEFGDEASREIRRRFASRTRCRAFQVSKTDQIINPNQEPGRNFNGVMFSGKWLAENMGFEDKADIERVRRAVQAAHQHPQVGFGEGSPSDWWAIVLADGDGMGQYISGNKLKSYENYIVDELVNWTGIDGKNRESLLEAQKRMGPATHVGLNRALLDFSNRLVPYLTEKRFCGKVVYSGGDDVLVVLPLEDLPEYLLSLRAAWCGGQDPFGEFQSKGGYWQPVAGQALEGVPNRSLFTMGEGATMSMGVVIAYKSVPLPTVLENLWEAEGDRAKEMPKKDGICFRVIYGSGNRLEALMKGNLLQQWWNIVSLCREELSPLLYRLAEELPQRVNVDNHHLFSKAASVIMSRRDENRQGDDFQAISEAITEWLDAWGRWAFDHKGELGTQPEDLGYLLRFSAFWIDKMVQRQKWAEPAQTDLEEP